MSRTDDVGVIEEAEQAEDDSGSVENVWREIETHPIVNLDIADDSSMEPVEQMRGQSSTEESLRMEDMSIRVGGQAYARMVDEPDTDSNETTLADPDQTEDAIKQLNDLRVQEFPNISMEQVYSEHFGEYHHRFCKNVLGIHSDSVRQRCLWFVLYTLLLGYGFCLVVHIWSWWEMLFAFIFSICPTFVGLILTWLFQRHFWVKKQLYTIYLQIPKEKTDQMAHEMRRNYWGGVFLCNVLYAILWVLYTNEVRGRAKLKNPYHPDELLSYGRCWVWAIIGEHVILMMIYGVTTHTYVCKLAKAFDKHWLPVIRKIRVADEFGLHNEQREEEVTMALQPYLEIRRKASYCYSLMLFVIFLITGLYSVLIACSFRKRIKFSDFPVPTPFGLLYRTEHPPQIYAVASVGYFCIFARAAHVFGYPFTTTKIFLSSKGYGLNKQIEKLLEAPIMFFHIPLTHYSCQYVIYGSNLIFLIVLLIVFFL